MNSRRKCARFFIAGLKHRGKRFAGGLQVLVSYGCRNGNHGAGVVARKQSSHSLYFCWKPNVILIAQENNFAPAVRDGLGEVLGGAKPLRVAIEANQARMLMAKRFNDFARAVFRTIIADDDFLYGHGLGGNAAKLFPQKPGAVIRTHRY